MIPAQNLIERFFVCIKEKPRFETTPKINDMQIYGFKTVIPDLKVILFNPLAHVKTTALLLPVEWKMPPLKINY